MPVPLIRFIVIMAIAVSVIPRPPKEVLERELQIDLSFQKIEETPAGRFTVEALEYDIDDAMINSRAIRKYSFLVTHLNRKAFLFHIQRRFNDEWLNSPGEVPQYNDWRLEEELDDGEVKVHHTYSEYRTLLFDFPAYEAALAQVRRIVGSENAGR